MTKICTICNRRKVPRELITMCKKCALAEAEFNEVKCDHKGGRCSIMGETLCRKCGKVFA